MSRWIIVGVGLSLLVVLFIMWRQPIDQSPPLDERETATGDAPIAPAEETPPAEETAPAEIRNQRIAPVVSNPTTPDQDEAMESQNDQMKKMVELSRPKKGGPLEILKRTYEDQSRDATASDVEKLLRDQFGTDYLPAESLHNVTCHEKVCKIEMYWTEKDPLALMAFVMKTGRLLTGYIASDPEPEPDREGRTLVSLYILREGDIADL